MEILRRNIDHEVRKDQSDKRILTFVASDGTRDRHHTVLNPQGWSLDRFNKNSIIGYQHDVYGGLDNDPDKIIGKGRAYIKDDQLLVDVEFEPADMNPLAEKIFRKLVFGSLHAVSVGFAPIGRGAWGKGEEAAGKERETYYYAGQELLEVSVVNIPSNPNAIKKSAEECEAELALLRAEATPEPEPIEEPAPEPEPTPEPEVEEKDYSAEIAKAEAIARAALL